MFQQQQNKRQRLQRLQRHRTKRRRQAYPSNKRVGSLCTIGSHNGIQILMHQGPYEHYAVPVAQRHCDKQLQANLQAMQCTVSSPVSPMCLCCAARHLSYVSQSHCSRLSGLIVSRRLIQSKTVLDKQHYCYTIYCAQLLRHITTKQWQAFHLCRVNLFTS